MMDAKRIADLRALLAKATPGPWLNDCGKVAAGERGHEHGIGEMDANADGAVVVALRNEADDLLRCAERVEKLERVAEAARALVAHEDATAMVCDLCGERVCIGECPVGGLRAALRDLDAKGG